MLIQDKNFYKGDKSVFEKLFSSLLEGNIEENYG